MSGLRGKHAARQLCVPQPCLHLPTAHPVLKPFHAGSTSLSPRVLFIQLPKISPLENHFPRRHWPGFITAGFATRDPTLEDLLRTHKPHDMTYIHDHGVAAHTRCCVNTGGEVQPLDETTAKLLPAAASGKTWTPPDAPPAVAPLNGPHRPPTACKGQVC